MAKTEQDPELLDDENEGLGNDENYDGEAVSSLPYDHALFELPEDFEVAEEDSDD